MDKDAPIFEETIKAYQNLEFLRDDKGRWIGFPDLGPKAGWYQDVQGTLYRYDGVIWDEVPKGRVESLEYLG
jgi:hypothetical protein